MASAKYQTVPFFLFETSWPLARFYQINGGHFPCFKVTDEQSGRIFLKPLETALIIKRYSLFVLTTLVLKALTFTCMWLTWNGLTYSDLSQVLEKHGQSKMDFATLYAVIGVSLVGHIIIVFRNVKYKDQLAQLQDMFAQNAIIDREILKAKKKWLVIFLILSVLFVWSGFLTFFVGMAMLLNEEFSVSLPSQIPTILLNTMAIQQLFTPMYAFTNTCVETACTISAWTETLLLTDKDLKDCYNLMQVISATSKAMSLQLFSVVTMSVMILIGVTFPVVSYFIVNEDLTAHYFLLFTLGIGLVAIFTIFFLVSLTSFSQKIVDKVHELGNAIRRLPVKDDKIVLEKDILEWRDFRDIVLHDMDSFEGLDGYGYFSINKSLLTSIVANFMTYIIILIDFKIN